MRVEALSPKASAEEVYEAIYACLRQVLPRRIARQPLSPETHLYRDLGLDSMQLLELVSLMEGLLGRTLSERELMARPIETIKDAFTLISVLVVSSGDSRVSSQPRPAVS